MTIKILRPRSGGAYTECDTYPGTGEVNWEDVDDIVPDYGSTYTFAAHVHKDLYTLQTDNTRTEVINKVTVKARMWCGRSGNYFKFLIRLLGTDYMPDTMYESVIIPWTWDLHTLEMTASPFSNTSWTWSEVNALQIGFLACPAGDAGNVACTQIYLYVNYSSEKKQNAFKVFYY